MFQFAVREFRGVLPMKRLRTVSVVKVVLAFVVFVTLLHYVLASYSAEFGIPDGGWSTVVRAGLISLLAIAFGVDIARYYGKSFAMYCQRFTRDNRVAFGVLSCVSVAVATGFIVIGATATLLCIEFVVWLVYNSMWVVYRLL